MLVDQLMNQDSLDAFITSLSGVNTPKNIPPETVHKLLLDRNSYRARNPDLSNHSNDDLFLQWFNVGCREKKRRFRPNFCQIKDQKSSDKGLITYLSSAERLVDGTFMYRTKYASMRDNRKSLFYTTGASIDKLLYKKIIL